MKTIRWASACAALGYLLIVQASVGHAQTPEWPAAKPADVTSIDAILGAVYDVISGPAGQQRDWDRFRSLFRPDARLIPTGGQAGAHRMSVVSPDEFATRAGPGFEADGFFEMEIARRIEQWGQIAHVFSTYESRRNADDATPFMRGINSFQLWNDGQRWWVVSIFWQNETPASPLPSKYLPGG